MWNTEHRTTGLIIHARNDLFRLLSLFAAPSRPPPPPPTRSPRRDVHALRPGPRGDCLREPVLVRRARDDAVPVHADHELRRDGGEHVDRDARGRVDVRVLLLAVERVQASLAVVLQDGSQTGSGGVTPSHWLVTARGAAHLEEAVQAGTCEMRQPRTAWNIRGRRRSTEHGDTDQCGAGTASTRKTHRRRGCPASS